MEILISQEQIEKRVVEIASLIDDHYKDRKPILICVLSGSVLFFTDLIKQLTIDIQIDFCRIKSYSDNVASRPIITQYWDEDLSGREVIVVEDILESGNSIGVLIEAITAQHSIKSINCISLLQRHSCPVRATYTGFIIEGDDFLVGYGLDDKKLKRNLKDIYKL